MAKNLRIALLGMAALMLLLGAGQAGASEVSDWRKQQEAQASAPPAPGSGSVPGSILVPGTNTSIKFGGYIKLDAIKDEGQNPGDFIFFNNIAASTNHAANRSGNVRFAARQSRFNVQTFTPSGYGTLHTYIEGDFYGTSPSANAVVTNSTPFALRHAYGEIGPLLIGHTWSVTMDLDSFPETVAFNGPIGEIFIRQSQIRYTYAFGPSTWIVAVENPESDFRGKNGGANDSISDQQNGLVIGPGGAVVAENAAPNFLSPNVLNTVPDFTTRLTTNQPWGELSAYGAARLLRADTGVVHATHFGYLVAGSGRIKTFGKDNVQFQANWADGGNRYIFYLFNLSGVWDGARSLESQQGMSGFLYYQHWWTETLRTNFGAGYLRNFNETALLGTNTAITREGEGAHINLIWSPVPSSNFGIEYSHARREFENRTRGEVNRFQIGGTLAF